jgi:DNA-directed RNA polymerase specialized sigma24 family protein
MTCCRKPGCESIAYDLPTGQVNRSCRGPVEVEHRDAPPAFDELVAALPDSQREAVTMLKVGGLSLAEVARATSSTVGAIKQMAHRAYRRLRELLETSAEDAVAALGYLLERCSRLVEAPHEENSSDTHGE